MADDREGDEPAVDPATQRLRRAQGTAGDLARMGIDPRSLGLGDPVDETPAAPAPPSASDESEGAQVVPLRPRDAVPPPPPSAPPSTPSSTPPPPPPGPAAHRSDRPGPSGGPQSFAPPPPAPPASRDTGRLVRDVGRGLVTPDAAAAVQSERDVVEAVRRRQTERRIVAFVSGKGGVGCTSVAVGVGTTFVALREDRSAVLDVQQGAMSLGATFGVQAPLDVLAVADPEVPVPTAPSGLSLVDGVEWDLTLSRGSLAASLDRLGGDHTFTLVDVGTAAGEGAHAALARADVVVAVTGAGQLGARALDRVVERVRDVNPIAAGRLQVVVVAASEAAQRTVSREQLGAPGAPVVLPPDPYLASGAAYDPARVGASTREALLRLSAAVATGAARA